MRLEYWNGHRQIVPISQPFHSDDAGQYRVTGLMPGTYLVQAKVREAWTVTENGKTEQLGYAPTFLPGITNFSEATKVTVGIGQQFFYFLNNIVFNNSCYAIHSMSFPCDASGKLVLLVQSVS